MKFIFQRACRCGGSEEITGPHPVCFHSPVNLDLLIVGGTIKTQQLLNNNNSLHQRRKWRRQQIHLQFRFKCHAGLNPGQTDLIWLDLTRKTPW